LCFDAIPRNLYSYFQADQGSGSINGDLLRDIAAINEFLFYLESEPIISSEKANNFKRVPFIKEVAA
jgi:hypothetical protein